jgi:prolyl oligopeptidase
LRNPLTLLLILQIILIGSLAMAQKPPVAPVQTVEETIHGERIVDHYRYLEDFQNPAVQAWVKQQAEYAERSLQALPGREKLLARLQEFEAGSPYRLHNVTPLPSGELFYFKQLAAENVAKVYVRRGNEEKILIDPEKFAKPSDGGHYSLTFYRVSPDGQRVAYGFAASGTEETSIRIFDRATGQDLPETIERVDSEYAQPDWLLDGSGFVYSQLRKQPKGAPAADGYKFTQSKLHRLGTSPDDDPLIFAAGASGSPSLAEMDFPGVFIPEDSAWVIGQVKHGDESDLTLYTLPRKQLGTPEAKWQKVCDRSHQVTDFAVHGNDIYLMTAQHAPRFKIVRTALAAPNFAEAAEMVPAANSVVDSLATAKDALYVGLREGVAQKILRVPYELDAKRQQISLPAGEPSASVSAARPDLAGLYLSTNSWTRGGQLYRFDPQTNLLTNTHLAPLGKYDAPDWLTSTEVMAPSHDGVAVPLSIIHRRDLKLDGNNPTLLSGYGAYGFAAPMNFRAGSLAWLERGGVLAIAHVRGGGAFGKEWHLAGRKLTKPNTWKDFIACAEYLIQKKYTSSATLAGSGGSAGGILIGRAITERPDLFAAAHISVGMTDTVRFETTFNGPPNVPEFGTVSKPDEFRGLLTMSTLHHIRDGVKYPGILLTHGVNDNRVEPWMSAKATARFQAATASARPVLFRVEYHAGHGIGSTRAQRQAELADIWSFLLWQFGNAEFQPRQ